VCRGSAFSLTHFVSHLYG